MIFKVTATRVETVELMFTAGSFAEVIGIAQISNAFRGMKIRSATCEETGEEKEVEQECRSCHRLLFSDEAYVPFPGLHGLVVDCPECFKKAQASGNYPKDL